MPSDRRWPRSRPRWPARSAPDRTHGDAWSGATSGSSCGTPAKSSSSWCRSSKPSSGSRAGSELGSSSPAPGPVWLNASAYSLVASAGTGSPAYPPVCRSRSRTPCKITTAAAMIDHGPALLALPSLRPELPLGSHRAQALVVQPDRDRLHPVGQVTCERPHLTGRRSFTPGHRAGQADVDAHRAELVDERSQAIEVALAARHGLHRGGEDARRVAAGDPDAGVAGVDPEAYAGELVAHQDRATRPDARQRRAGQPPGPPRPGWRRHRRPAPRRPCRRPCRRGSPRPRARGCSPRCRRPGRRR